MRRIMVVLVAAGVLLVGCSSSKKESSSPSSSSSTTKGTVANAPGCAELDAVIESYGTAKENAAGGSDQEAVATSLQSMYAALVPDWQAAQQAVPSEIQPSVAVFVDYYSGAASLDPKNADDQSTLTSYVFNPPQDLADATSTIGDWAQSTCGVSFP